MPPKRRGTQRRRGNRPRQPNSSNPANRSLSLTSECSTALQVTTADGSLRVQTIEVTGARFSHLSRELSGVLEWRITRLTAQVVPFTGAASSGVIAVMCGTFPPTASHQFTDAGCQWVRNNARVVSSATVGALDASYDPRDEGRLRVYIGSQGYAAATVPGLLKISVTIQVRGIRA
jgi:hypothetical protein